MKSLNLISFINSPNWIIRRMLYKLDQSHNQAIRWQFQSKNVFTRPPYEYLCQNTAHLETYFSAIQKSQ